MKYLFVSSLSDIPPLASTCPNRRNEIGGTPPNPADGNDCIAFASNFLFHSSRYTPGTKSETANYYRIHFNFRTENLQYSELSVFPDSYALQSLPALHYFPRAHHITTTQHGTSNPGHRLPQRRHGLRDPSIPRRRRNNHRIVLLYECWRERRQPSRCLRPHVTTTTAIHYHHQQDTD